MSDTQNDSTALLNRLRAAAGLIPIIESGLADQKISHERASHMAIFCQWATQKIPDDPVALDLADTVSAGLQRLKTRLSPENEPGTPGG
jgi:hypothetical protein